MISFFVDFEIETPRLCVHITDPTQYYPCVLNYIGTNSWSLYHCPDGFKFDERMQQCVKPNSIDLSSLFEKKGRPNIQFESSMEPMLIQKLFNDVRNDFKTKI